jgi:DnaJ-class molecular chaperone
MNVEVEIECSACEGKGKVVVDVEPTTYSGSGREPSFRDVWDWCSHCEGTGVETEDEDEDARAVLPTEVVK